MAELSLRQQGASISSQVGLLSVLEPKTLYRNDLKLDLVKEVHLLAKEMMK
jgi:hypothetical protein